MYRLFLHHKKYGFKHSMLYKVCGMLFFWTLFEGIMGYTVPFLVKERNISTTSLGLIYASSSIFGAFFDFFASKIFRKTTYRRFYLYMFVLSLLYLFIVWNSNHIITFLIAMGVWGIYYDFHNLGNFDFVHRVADKSEHSSYYGVITVFRSLGYLIAPLIAGIFLIDTVNNDPLLVAGGFLSIAFVIYLLFINKADKNLGDCSNKTIKLPTIISEFHNWKILGKKLLPIFLFIISISVFTSFIGTIGSLLSEELASKSHLGLLFVPTFLLPTLIVGWFNGRINKRYGVKNTAYVCFIIGLLILSTLIFFSNVYVIIGIVFISSCFTALSLPSVNGFFEDYIDEFPTEEHEIEGLSDFFYNIGYVIGPALAGVFADLFGLRQAFGILGIGLAMFVMVLFYFESVKCKMKN